MRPCPPELTVHQEDGYLGFSWSVASVLRTQSCARESQRMGQGGGMETRERNRKVPREEDVFTQAVLRAKGTADTGKGHPLGRTEGAGR